MPMPREVGSELVMAASDAPDVTRVLEAYRRRLRRAAPEDLELGMRTVRRLKPPRWALEWQLPAWLGGAFGLDPTLTFELVVSTVFGLVSIRLQDDLADGEVDVADRGQAARVADACYREALTFYRDRLQEASPFWPFLDRTMRAWRSPGRHLASRGAPLKVPAFGACLLGDRLDAWPRLESCIDRALTAFVLYDHFLDWEADFAAGRWNSFVASIDGAPDERTPSRVRLAMLTRGVVERTFERIASDSRAAGRLAADLGLPELSAHFEEYAELSDSQGAASEQRYQRAADRMTRLMFGRGVEPTTQAPIRGGLVQ